MKKVQSSKPVADDDVKDRLSDGAIDSTKSEVAIDAIVASTVRRLPGGSADARR